MTLILSGTNGVSDIDGDASTPALRGTDANSGVFFGADIVGVSTGGSEKVSVGASALVINEGGADFDFRVEGDTDANLLFVDASTDRVGVGTNAPGQKLEVNGNIFINSSGNPYLQIKTSGAGNNPFARLQADTAYWDIAGIFSDGTDPLQFAYGGSEKMRIDSSGNLLVATTGNVAASGAGGNEGFYYQADDFLAIARSGGQVVYLNRLDSDGSILEFRKDGTAVGSIGSRSGLYSYFEFGSIGTGIGGTNAHAWLPMVNGERSNNTTDLGQSSYRFSDIFLVNSPNVSSDRNIKQDIEELSEAETRVAVACKSLLRKYRLKDAVAKKGDDARIHIGIIAQDLKAAFEAEGLDAHRYGMFMWNDWWEKERIIPAVEGKEAVYETQTDEEGNETQVLVSEAVEAQAERTVIDTFETEEEAGEGAVRKERMGIRYNELLAFIIAAI